MGVDLMLEGSPAGKALEPVRIRDDMKGEAATHE